MYVGTNADRMAKTALKDKFPRKPQLSEGWGTGPGQSGGETQAQNVTPRTPGSATEEPGFQDSGLLWPLRWVRGFPFGTSDLALAATSEPPMCCAAAGSTQGEAARVREGVLRQTEISQNEA